METSKLSRISFWTLPFKVNYTEMSPNLLLMCKIFVVLLYTHGFYTYLNDPFLPVIPVLDKLNSIPFLFKYLSKIIFLLASLSLLFNVRVRTMSIVLGTIIILNLMASKPMFRNHLFIIGCFLFLAGLTPKNQSPLLIYYQLGIVYVGALINKAFQIDWWSGQFMHNWLGTALDNKLYLWTAEQIPNMLLAKLISYMAMLSELVIAFCLFVPKLRRLALRIILVFHTLLFTFTGETFGFFMEDILIVLIAFLVWPKNQSELNVKSSKHFKWLKVLSILDFDNRVLLNFNNEMNENLVLSKNDKKYKNWAAFTQFLLQCNGFFILLLVLEMGIRYVFNGTPKYVALLLLLWIFIVFLSPLAISKNNIKEI